MSKIHVVIKSNNILKEVKRCLSENSIPFSGSAEDSVVSVVDITQCAMNFNFGNIPAVVIIPDDTLYAEVKAAEIPDAHKKISWPSEKNKFLNYLKSILGNEEDSFFGIKGRSKSFVQLKDFINKAAPSSYPVLIEGESGTGKELIAHALHKLSKRAAGPYITVNCGAIPKELVENELFGHESGAFTGATCKKSGLFEAADGGTLFIDEIGELSYEAQVKLLRVLENNTYRRLGGNAEIRTDARIIAATNKVLENEVDAGRFRLDLYYRLCVLRLFVKPLRERKEDISVIADYYLAKVASDKMVSEDFMKSIQEYSWPGNIRELKNIIERAAILCEGKIGKEHLPDYISDAAFYKVSDTQELGMAEFTNNTEKEFIRRALEKYPNNKTKAAEALGITRFQLYRKIIKHNLV